MYSFVYALIHGLLLVACCWLLVTGFWLLVAGCLLLVSGYWLHVQGSKFNVLPTAYCLLPLPTATAYCHCLLPLPTATAYCYCLLLLPTATAYSPGHTPPINRLSSFRLKQGIGILLPFQVRYLAWRTITATPAIGWPATAQQALFFLHHVMSLIFIHFSCVQLFQFSWDQMVEHQIHNEPLVIILC
jgi:hypothetical protein